MLLKFISFLMVGKTNTITITASHNKNKEFKIHHHKMEVDLVKIDVEKKEKIYRVLIILVSNFPKQILFRRD